MSNNNKSIESYLKSARKFKSPISTDNARSLIEMSDLKKPDQISFFSKKGVIIMAYSSAIIGTLIFFAFIFNVFNNISQKSELQVSSSKNSQFFQKNDLIAANSKTKSNNNKIYSASDKDSIITQKDNSNTFINSVEEHKKFEEFKQKNMQSDKITGMNSIKLTDKESADFGIIFDSLEVKGSYKPCINYWVQETAKSSALMKFAKEMHTRRSEKLPSELNIKYLTLKPDMITDFDGTKRLYSSYPIRYVEGLDEFMKFNKSLKAFYSLDFNQDYFPSKIPDVIIKQLAELQKIIFEYQIKTENNDDLDNLIDNKIKEIYKYFYNISKLDSIEQRKFGLTEKDTNMSQVMIMFSDKLTDSTENAYIEKMAKMGIKVVYTKHRMTIKEYLKDNYPELESKLTSFSKQIDSYIMINKMVAVEIPYKNDPNYNGLVFWYYPNQDLIDAMPERYRTNLANEFKLLANEEAICGAKIDAEKSYLDIWRACSGAIENLRVFPNPVKDILTIKFELKEERNMTYSIYDLNGTKIKDLSENHTEVADSKSLTFNLSELTKGMYLFVASSTAGETSVQRIIKE
jgi:hypothetical protein